MFDPENFVEEKVAELSNIQGKAIIACSGGVDSVVSAVIASRAIGDRLLAVYVDTGLMRSGETEQVYEMLSKLGVNFKVVDASSDFFKHLKGVNDPERKRKVIGERFIRCFEKEAKLFGAKHLVQGTIAPDWIESGSGGNSTVKSHHNVGGLPKRMGLELIEPLYYLYKNDVREVARYLKVEVAERQPFPGPALAVRCLDDVTEENIAVVREACRIVEEEIQNAAAEKKMELPWQYFAVLLPVRSVGVRNDERSYGKTIAVRAVGSSDGMTATCSNIPMDVLKTISKRITDTIGSVNRVIYDITDKPPSTIEWQ